MFYRTTATTRTSTSTRCSGVTAPLFKKFASLSYEQQRAARVLGMDEEAARHGTSKSCIGRCPQSRLREVRAARRQPEKGSLGYEMRRRVEQYEAAIASGYMVEDIDKVGGRQQIVITELPYQLNKARLIEKIAELVKEKKIEGITELRDESDKDGMRVVIELRRGEVPEVILNNLYAQTQLQSVFGINVVALVDGQPRTLNLKELLEAFVRHRREVVTRRTVYELRKARERGHILPTVFEAQHGRAHDGERGVCDEHEKEADAPDQPLHNLRLMPVAGVEAETAKVHERLHQQRERG